MGELEGAKTLLKEETLRITKHGRYGLPNKEAAGLVRMGRKRLGAHALTNHYGRRAGFLNVSDFCVEDVMFLSRAAQDNNMRDSESAGAIRFTLLQHGKDATALGQNCNFRLCHEDYQVFEC